VLFINWPVYLTIAREARDKAIEIMSGDPNSAPTDALVAIVMSALAAEAFINELAWWADMHTADIEIGVSSALDLLREVADALAAVEANKGPTELKYQTTAEILSGSAFRRGDTTFQNFRNLFKLRDMLVHLQPRDDVGPHGNIIPSSKLIRNLQQAGLTRTRGQRPDKDTPGMSWILEIQTASMAAWAYKASAEIIKALGQRLPGEGSGTIGISWFKRTTENIHT
jgi:hypothetical protein